MRSIAFLVAGPLETRTGGSLYNRRVVEGLRHHGWQVAVDELDASFPHPSAAAQQAAAAILNGLAPGTVVVVDGLAYGALAPLVERTGNRLRFVPIVHLPLGADVNLDATTAARLNAGEQRALAHAALVVVTGAATVPLMARLGLTAARVVVVEPGTDPAPLGVGSGSAIVHLLTVAAVHAGKGHELLVAALAAVPSRTWHLTCAGNLARDPATVARVRAAIAHHGLDDHIALTGELDARALGDAYHAADLFVLATRQETYGMAVAEALARGLAGVGTATGAIPSLLQDDAGIVVPAGDAAALCEALTRVIADPSLRARLAAGARRTRSRLRDWARTSAEFAAALESIDGHG